MMRVFDRGLYVVLGRVTRVVASGNGAQPYLTVGQLLTQTGVVIFFGPTLYDESSNLTLAPLDDAPLGHDALSLAEEVIVSAVVWVGWARKATVHYRDLRLRNPRPLHRPSVPWPA